MSKSLEWRQIPPQKFIFSSKQTETQAVACGTGSPGAGLARVTRSPGPLTAGHPRVPCGDSHPHFPLRTGTDPPSLAECFKARGRGSGAHPGDHAPFHDPAISEFPAPSSHTSEKYFPLRRSSSWCGKWLSSWESGQVVLL